MSSHLQQQRPNLQRGGACVNCRRRKMRCDGARPVCGQCEHAGRPDDCEYVSGQERSRTQILEENISRLEARIQELQNPNVGVPGVSLHQPYGGPSPQLPSSLDPPAQLVEKLLNYFLPYGSEFGLFLQPSRLRASTLSGAPAGHPTRPTPALLCTMYLWGVSLSQDPGLLSYEESYLNRAVQQASTALSGSHPHKVVHALQAEVLLSYYFFSKGRFPEGKYHVTVAVSTAVSAGLTRLRSRQPVQTNGAFALSPPSDPIEEGERIAAFWTVFNLDKYWSAALESSPNMAFTGSTPETQVDTPWPLEMTDYEQGRFPSNIRTSHTLQKFITGASTSDSGMSSKAFLSKAALLWERANQLAQEWSPRLSQDQYNSFINAFSSFDALLTHTQSSVGSISQIISGATNPEQLRTLIVAYSVLHASTIRLHTVFASTEASKLKIMSSARSVIDIIVASRQRNLIHLNPIIGTAWVDASQVVVNEIVALRSVRSSTGSSTPTEAETSLMQGFQRSLAAITAFSDSCILTAYQVRKIQDAYNSLY
ncbi:hypothetical protein BDQ17DRAFT_1248425 [Cyathus striatus]|nr:hypothetical protein BDQ17DRAFT_1248425 [Cyathus striatus]